MFASPKLFFIYTRRLERTCVTPRHELLAAPLNDGRNVHGYHLNRVVCHWVLDRRRRTNRISTSTRFTSIAKIAIGMYFILLTVPSTDSFRVFLIEGGDLQFNYIFVFPIVGRLDSVPPPAQDDAARSTAMV